MRKREKRARLAAFLSKVLLLSLFSGIAAPILAPSTFSTSANATSASLHLNIDKFLQWTTWKPDGAGLDNTYTGSNHGPYVNQSTTPVSGNGNLIVLTNIGSSQTGYLWSTEQYSYARDFSVTAAWYLGQKDAEGADGMSFVMRPLSSWPNGGSAAGSGNSHSRTSNNEVRITVDTYQNPGEIADDHLSIISTNSSGVVTEYTGSGVALKNSNCDIVTNVEDNNYSRYYTVQWIASSRTLNFFAGDEANCEIFSTVISATEQDATTFSGGFLAETGGANNYQGVRDVDFGFRFVPATTDSDTALSFNGSNQFADAPSDSVGSIYDFGSTWTTQAWIKPGAKCEGAYCNIIGKEYSFLISTIGNKLIFSTGNGSSWTIIWREAGGFIPTGTWSHVATTYTGTTLTVYVNGRPVHVSNSVTAVGNNAERFTIGGRTVLANDGVSFENFQGEIDEVRVWNSARSQANIESDMHNRPTLTDANLKAYFDFNERSGSSLINRAANSLPGRDLTLENSPSWQEVNEVSVAGAYTIAKFPRSFITAGGGWKAPTGVTRVSALVVAGGGGGGSRHAGGGGGGGVSYAPSYTLDSGATFGIRVGTGGLGYGRFGNNPYVDANNIAVLSAGDNANGSGTSGSSSTLLPANVLESITAPGGGGGGGTGISGGSGGGSNASGSTPGGSTKYSTAFFTSYGFSGGYGYSGSGCGNDWCGGGGGGAGGEGGTPVISPASPTRAGNGGNGFEVAIESLSTAYYGGGGGGGSATASIASTGGSGGGGAGGNNAQGLNGTNGLGGGGGGGGFSGATSYRGGNGGSGVIVIRWITAAKPIFTGPAFDTLTAGLVETFTVTGSPVSPLTRSFRWQSSTDTGSVWSNISSGSGFLTSNYTTPTLETNTSGIRYQYRVVVTDSDTAGLFIVETSTAVYLTINPRNTITSNTGSAIFTQKYGESQTAIFSFAFGTGTRTPTVVTTTNNQNGRITWSNLISASATMRVGTGLPVGTHSETLTVTDSVSSSTTQGISITVSKADTITVTTTLSTNSVTYTESPANVTVTQIVTGLVNSETATVTNTYREDPCIYGGSCLVSNTVPTEVGTYKVGSTFAISSPATLSNYQGIESTTATLTINQARQKAISIGQYEAYPNISSYPINVYGGSGPGAVVRTLVSAGTAGCSLASNLIITATSIGTCSVRAVKAGTRNYFAETATATITWITWSTNYAVQSLGGSHSIPLSGGNQVIVKTETVTASAFSDTSGNPISSATVGTTIRINSTGFAGLTPAQITTTFRPYEDGVVTAVTSTYVELVVPAGAVTGVIALDSPRGVAYTPSFTISP